MIDPSRTLTIRRAFVADMRRRFAYIKRQIQALIVDLDVFGIKRTAGPLVIHAGVPEVGRQAWRFRTDPEKVSEFRKWLEAQTTGADPKLAILGRTPDGKPWLSKYIESAYKKGQVRAYREAYGELVDTPAGLKLTDDGKLFGISFAGPEETKRIEAIYTRAWNDLAGVNDAMKQKLSRTLSRSLALGLAEGRSPYAIARDMRKEIDSLSKLRAETIARTEVIAAHAEGQLDAYDALQVKKVQIQAEWLTAGDNKVCPQCDIMGTETMTIKQARGLIPLHPNCVLGNSIVVAPDILCMMRGHYTGEIVEFVTANGRRFAVTGNHILLTQNGFRSARAIHEGEYLVETPAVDGSVQNPNVNGDMPSIEECFASLAELEHMFSRRMPTAPEDFHNEGRFFDSEVCIIWPDCELWDQAKVGGCEGVERALKALQFARLHSSLSAAGSLAQFLHRIAFAANGCMSRFCVPSVLGRAAALHHKAIGGGASSNGDARIGKAEADSVPVNPYQSLQAVEAPTGGIQAYDFGGVQLTFDKLTCVRVSHVTDTPVYDLRQPPHRIRRALTGRSSGQSWRVPRRGLLHHRL